MGAWIETGMSIAFYLFFCVAPSWERGLKLKRRYRKCRVYKVAPLWERGLKPE